MLEAGLHVANRGVVLNGTTWFELHRTGWLAVVLSLAGVLLGLAFAIAFRSRTAERRQTRSATRHAPVFAVAVLAVWAVANGVAFIEWVEGECVVPVVRYPRCADRADAPPCDRTRDAHRGHERRQRAVLLQASRDRHPGKERPVIAHMAPVSGFLPGHNKWNLDHSIRDGGPDLIFGLPRAPGEVDYLVRLGYRSYPGTCFARPDSARVNHAALWRGMAALYPNAPAIPIAAM